MRFYFGDSTSEVVHNVSTDSYRPILSTGRLKSDLHPVFDCDSGPTVRHRLVTTTRSLDVDTGDNLDTVTTTRRDPGFRTPPGEPEP